MLCDSAVCSDSFENPIFKANSVARFPTSKECTVFSKTWRATEIAFLTFLSPPMPPTSIVTLKFKCYKTFCTQQKKLREIVHEITHPWSWHPKLFHHSHLDYLRSQLFFDTAHPRNNCSHSRWHLWHSLSCYKLYPKLKKISSVSFFNIYSKPIRIII